MANKSIKFAILSLFAIFFLASFASAFTVSGNDFSGNSTTIIITTNSTENGTVALTFSGDLTVPSTTLSVNNGTSTSKSVSFTEDIEDLDLWTSYSVTVNATLNGESNSTVLNFTKDFYTGENKGKLKVTDIEFNVVEGFGDDDNYWYPLDEVEVTFTVENNGNWDIAGIGIEACLLDQTKGKCVMDEGDMEIDTDDFDLDSGDDQDVTLSFQINPENLKAGNTKYAFYIKAVGDIDDSEADDYDGDETGASSSKSGTPIVTNDEFVVINNIHLEPSSISCDDTVTLTADVWNIGDSNLKDDKVYVSIYNKELGINKVVNFESGIDSMDYEKIQVSLDIPEVTNKDYKLQLIAYDDDNLADKNIFSTKEDDDEAVYSTVLKVSGTCSPATPQASISATLESEEIKAGKELVVKTVITNTNTANSTFTLSASDYEDWASLVEMDKTSMTLKAGASQEVLTTLRINKDASGNQTFNFVVKQGDKVVSKPVTVVIEESNSSSPFTGLLSNLKEGNNWLWVVVGLNVVLIGAIVIVVIRMVKKKKK